MSPPGSNYAPTSHAKAVAQADTRSGGAAPVPPASESTHAGAGHHAASGRSLVVGVLTTSDTFTEEDDASGDLAKRLLREAGHRVAHYALVANSVADIRDAVTTMLGDHSVEAVITLGGTGVSSRDVTVDALQGLGGKPLEGFGDLYRMLSFQEVGPVAVLSRASLFAIQNRPVFALPGSERGCQLALKRLVLPAVEHLIDELAR